MDKWLVFLDFCNNAMPARIMGVDEDASGRMCLHLKGLMQRELTDAQWSAAHAIAQQFGMHPGRTTWQPRDADATGHHGGTLTFERWHVRSN